MKSRPGAGRQVAALSAAEAVEHGFEAPGLGARLVWNLGLGLGRCRLVCPVGVGDQILGETDADHHGLGQAIAVDGHVLDLVVAIRLRLRHPGLHAADIAVADSPLGIAAVVAADGGIDGERRTGVGVDEDSLAGGEVGAGIEDGLGRETEPVPVLAVDLGQTRVDAVTRGD